MFLKVCSVCSARSSLTTLPVFGSKPPWPDRKIHSPTVSPGEYGPAGAGTLSELIRAFMAEVSSNWQAAMVPKYTYRSVYCKREHHARSRRPRQVRLRRLTPLVPRPDDWHGASRRLRGYADGDSSLPIGMYTTDHDGPA